MEGRVKPLLTGGHKSKFQLAYGRPLNQRCPELEQLINNSSNKDLSSILPGLLENIFGSSAEPGWGLDTITKSQPHSDYDTVMRFLGPEGPLLKLVCHLQTDVYLMYEFPFANLPSPTRHMIEEGSLPMFYVNKLQFQSYTKPVLRLGAFELYLFYFSVALVSHQWQMKSLNWNNMTEVVYPCLLDKYLDYFLPLNKKSLPKFPQSISTAVRSPMMQQTPTSQKHSPGSGAHTRSRSRLGLLKANLLTTQKPHGQSSPVTEKVEGDIWWSETFVQILAEFWLNQNALDIERGISPQNLSRSWSSYHLSESFMPFYHAGTGLESYMPSNNHVRLVRLFLKHIHYFVNSAEPEPVSSPYQTAESSPLDEFKRSLLPTVLQKKVYGFLKHGFERWPLDSSFRLMLETWLTYIQPWRYIEPGPVHQTKDSDKVNDLWFPFIRDNFLFYTALFQEFLQRAKRMHLTSITNAYIVFRVAKVLNLTNLPQLLREAEKMMYPLAYKQLQDLGGSYIAPELSTLLRFQISELERPEFHYINMFGRETETEVQQLLQQIHTAKTVLSAQQPEKKAEKSGLASWLDFSSLFEDTTKAYGDMSITEVKKLVLHLDQAASNLYHLFSLKPTDMTMPHSPGMGHGHTLHAGDQSSFLNTTLSTSVPRTPDCEFTRNGPQLTPMGRFQLMNGLRKFEIGYNGDPDLQPIRSFENSTLVRVLYRLSACINKMFQNEILNLYQRDDIIGKMSQVYFAAPLSPSKIPSSPMSRETIQTLRTPRLSLRYLASYQTLLYLGLMYAFLRFSFGFGPVGYMIVLLLCVLVYGLFRALTIPEERIEN
ncbi:sphingomyelin phosphodiesterase 4-like isoform X2 [Mercenaria mercenaria]|uniref:sphingomyelin phosphodiesterase 4-like isoform X2 n=1 Tax=Mercenaria mercenaria TaxID=6596 RepID=UPI00234F1DEE|nr:sphingomyelin phosphodiesterase 4-like isoform X2 [Mercenaria mercenaria]